MSNNVTYTLSLRDLLSAGINSANNSVNRLESSLRGVQSSAMSLGSALGVTFGIAGVVAFTKSVITAGTTVENALTGLTTLLGNAKEAQGVIDNTMTDATKTPFAFEGLLSANKALISAGETASKSREDVLNLANAIAATGGGDNELQRMVVNLQQIRNTGKATAMDIKQFAFAGVNIYKVLEAAGIKANKKGEDSAITYQQITEALKKAHEAGGIYYNGLENMAGNTSVKISNLGDAFFQLSVKIFQDLKPAIEKVLGAMFKFVDWLKKAWEWCVKYQKILKNVAITLGEAWLAFKTLSLAIPIIEGIGIAFSAAATGGIPAFGRAITAAMGPMGLFITATTTAIFLLNQLKDLQNAGTKKGEERGEALDAAKKEQEEYLQGLIVGKEAHAIQALIQTEIDTHKALREVYRNASQAAQNDYARYDLYDKQQVETVKINTAMDFLEAQKKEGLVPSKAASSVASGGSSTAKKSGEKSQATGSKAVTINVSIKDLIGTYNMNVTNVKEMGSKVKDIVVQALTGAVNDFQVTAGS